MAKINERINRHGQKEYYTMVNLGKDRLTGDRVRKQIKARTKKELELKASRLRFNFEQNGNTFPVAPEVKTFNDLFIIWWDTYKDTIKPNTKQSMYGMINKHILPVFGKYKLDKLTSYIIYQQVKNWADKANNHGGYQKYSLLLSTTKRIIDEGMRLELIDKNPAASIKAPRLLTEDTKTIKFFDIDELKQFYDYLDTLDQTDFKHCFNVTLYKFLMATGCRINEALAVEWSDVDFSAKTVHITKTLNRQRQVNSPKSKAGIRVIDIDDKTVAMLKDYKERQEKEFSVINKKPVIVFGDFFEKYSSDKTLREQLKRHFEKANVENISFHGFRHTHATHLLANGAQITEVQTRLGHSSVNETLNTYAHSTKEGQKKTVAIVATIINNL